MIAGFITMFAGNTAPDGFLVCDGSEVSRSIYSDLYDVIGTTYGAGDGISTFNLPDLSGRVPMGRSSTYVLGSSGGSETCTLAEAELPVHAHEVPTHTHSNNIAAKTPSYSHTVSTQPAFNYNKPNGTNTIYTGTSGGAAYSGTSSVNATLSTQVGIDDHPATGCTMGGSVTDCDAFDTESTGSGSAHNNMQPYITLLFIISTGD